MKIDHWFTGIVEDVNDPLQVGRVRVRCINYHSGDQSDIRTEDLPWSHCVLPVTNAATSGIGTSATGLVPGSWVLGFFRDGSEMQDAVILGSLGSVTSSFPAGVGSGFADPNGFFPLSLGNDMPFGSTTAGYNSQYGTPGVGDGTGAYGIPPSTFGAGSDRAIINGSVSAIITAGKSQAHVVETSKDRGPDIQKYWSATDNPNAYGAAWCAAFVCWCVRQSGILTEVDRPKTASAFGFEGWARSKPSLCQLRVKPTFIKAGDLVIFTHSHIGIALTDSGPNATFQTIDGNWGSRVNVGSNRNLSQVRSTITIGGGTATQSSGVIPGAWTKGLPNTTRGAGGLQFTSYGQANDKTPDSNTIAKRGFRNNLLTEGSVALSPEIYGKYNPQLGAAVYVNDRLVGYYEDRAPSSHNGMGYGSVIDIYDPNGKIGPILKTAGQNPKITFGPARPQTLNA